MRTLFLLISFFAAVTAEADEEFVFWGSTIGGHKFLSGPSWQWIRDTPNWSPGQPLPITVEAAIASAKTEVERHSPKSEVWTFYYLDILSLRSGHKDKWYFLVELGAMIDATHFQRARVPVNLNGVACELFEDHEKRTTK